MAYRFLSMGECMVELAPLDSPDQYQRRFAGDTFNTAWYAAQLSRAPQPAPNGPESSANGSPQSQGEALEVAYLTAVGQDRLSSDLLAFIEDAGIRPFAARRPDRTLGLYMIALAQGERSFAYWRSEAAARTFVDGLDRLPLLDAGDVAFFSGITLGILDTKRRAALLDLLAEAKSRGVRLAFDMNLRPKLWPDAATMCSAVEEAARLADMVFPSFDDEAQFFGDASPEATADRYLALGASTALVRNGAQPVLIACAGPGERRWVEASPVDVDQVIDTTAAGDSFNGAFFARYLTGSSLEDAVRYGCEIAARVITKRGALVRL